MHTGRRLSATNAAGFLKRRLKNHGQRRVETRSSSAATARHPKGWRADRPPPACCTRVASNHSQHVENAGNARNVPQSCNTKKVVGAYDFLL
jgi:hypothetical protein